ncbi:TPA: efflux RND transporter permease subunit, partial [Klebsiella pneumoniae]|nr:efflux RND transporter permease subunit [Klebsiella pneumoniae]
MLTFFIRRPRFAMVIALLLAFVGAVSLKLIPVEQYPAITPPVVNVSASWPGASASDVAEAIAAPLETQLNGVDHMLYMESTSSDEGTYRLSITFAAGTDADLAAIDVQNRVAQALAQLPAEVQQNGVQVRKRASNLLMGVSLYSPLGTLSPLFVSNYASTQVREALARLPGVGEVQMFGARDYSMRIWLRPDRMNALNITTDDVAQALREQ